jgi:RimJ/RimL family protein N-acetyltransferase
MDGAPQIRRTPAIQGWSVVLRDVEESDAEFILSLRLDPARNQFLSPVPDDLERQRAWIRGYHASSGQAYFIICDRQLRPLGTVRVYDAVGDSFSWGSWILKQGVPPTAAIESALLVYRLGLAWGFDASHFKVHRANTSVVQFHESFGAERTAETEEEIFFRLDRAAIERALKRYARFLPATGNA